MSMECYRNLLCRRYGANGNYMIYLFMNGRLQWYSTILRWPDRDQWKRKRQLIFGYLNMQIHDVSITVDRCILR